MIKTIIQCLDLVQNHVMNKFSFFIVFLSGLLLSLVILFAIEGLKYTILSYIKETGKPFFLVDRSRISPVDEGTPGYAVSQQSSERNKNKKSRNADARGKFGISLCSLFPHGLTVLYNTT